MAKPDVSAPLPGTMLSETSPLVEQSRLRTEPSPLNSSGLKRCPCAVVRTPKSSLGAAE